MSGAELHFIRARLWGGILSKARRGDVPMPPPVGLVRDPAGWLRSTQTAPSRGALRYFCQTFQRTGSARAGRLCIQP
jgi:hypothetical protein